MDYDALAALLGGKAKDEPAADLDALAQQYGGKPAAVAPLTSLEAGGAIASGFNNGVFAKIPGLVADTGANIMDLARAGYGYAGNKLGVLQPEEMPQPLNRHNVVGSSAWIEDQFNKSPLTAAAINNPRPDVLEARVLNAGGTALGTSMAGRPSVMGMQFGSGALGQTATELTGNPNWGMVASVAPQALVTGGAGAARYAGRGDEAGRQQLAQRVQDFKNAGIDPTVGLATGNRVPQAIEATLSRLPGGAGVMATKAQSIQDQMQASANAARDNVSSIYGPVAAGDAIKNGAQLYRSRQQQIYGEMLDRALAQVPQGMTFPVSGLLSRGDATLAAIPNAPNVSNILNQPRQFTAGLLSALEKDAAPQAPTQAPTGLLGSNGAPITREVPGTPGGLPLNGLLDLRGRIGDLAYANNPLNTDTNTGALKNLYGGAKQDIANAGLLADAQRIANGQPPAVASGLDRASRFYSATQDVLDQVLAPLYKTAEASPERAYGRVENDARNSGQNVQRLMSSLPLDARRTVGATAIDRLGRASPGQQNAEGTAFSPQTFLTNWSKISPEAKSGLLDTIPNGSSVRTGLDQIAKAAERISQAGKVFANPSGTSGATAALGQAGTVGASLYAMASGHVGMGLTGLGAVLGTQAMGRLGAWAMTNPKTVTWLTQASDLRPDQMQGHVQRLAALANASRDPNERAHMTALAGALSSELGR